MKKNTLSIIIPSYNEASTLPVILKKIDKLKLPNNFKKEIIVINDASSDNTKQILKNLKTKIKFKLLNNNQNLGKTGTVKKGILSSKGEVVVVQDADLEYNPKDLKTMLKSYMKNKDKVIYGNRFNTKNKDKGKNYLGNIFLTFVTNIFSSFYGVYIKDMNVCYKMANGNIYRKIAKTICSNRFGFEPEITAKFIRLGLKIENVDIKYFPRNYSQGKKIRPIYDGLKVLWYIIKFNSINKNYIIYND